MKPITAPIHNTESEEEEIINSKAKMTKKELQKKIKEVEKEMYKASKEFDFEKAIKMRDIMFELKAELNGG